MDLALASALAIGLAAFGSAIAQGLAASAAAAATSEKPDLFGKMLIFAALPETQAIYGLVIAYLLLSKIV
ncbi:NEQ217 [Nanoarchaeum equitans Kin4-M]|uniref:NEQ217 n=1 Tax=Nanoarchaeum equitans (strain Kin4-M) TaxID=228908 RepID=Q74MQ9_NANEQ|nr:NEQ217 [Nanoarchaeum equitans Kin4-M]